MALELERMHPRTFSNISLLADDAPMLLDSIGRNLFRQDDITWGKIISFLTLSSAFVIDCVKSGQHEFVQTIIDVACVVMSEEAGVWIELQGGLNSLSEHIKPIRSEHISFLGLLEVLVGFLFVSHWSWYLVKFLTTRICDLF
jgi:Apoptosis regulator proteins, Bcl-2 family